ncbi:MAG: Spi family protease inhibitor [Bacteroidetes bacterium]|nr:Spi family protease inhibitor [Bacteroidota bacterium]
MKKIFVIALILMLGFSCSKKTEIENQIQPNQENFVSMDMVVDIAYNIKFPNMKNGSSLKSANKKTKEVKKIDEVKNKNEVTAFYVVNYNEGGFLLISSDLRTSPIIGFSEKGSFDMDEANMPDGLRFWIKDAKKQFFEIQKSDIKPSAKEKIAWKLVKESLITDVSSLKSIPIPGCYEHTEVVTKGPLSTSSAWGQKDGFYNSLPYNTCEGIEEHAYAGCGPIAMGQIMDYYEYPNSWNWTNIPTDLTTTSSFIANIWYNINDKYQGYPHYVCGATGIFPYMIAPVLNDKFGFTSASFADYNYQTVKSNLWYNKPVILSGGGHAWFCDGYKTVGYYWDDCTGTEYLYFYMKWGSYGIYDGWFCYNKFNPGIFNFSEDEKMVYNIYP